MRRLFLVAIIILVASVVPPPLQARADPPASGSTPSQLQRSEVLEKVLPAVVAITTRKSTAPPDTGQNASGTGATSTRAYGSGFVIDPSGVIVTNFHVVRDAWEIDVTFQDGTWIPAHLLKATQLIDIALLKVDLGHPVPALSWGDSGKLQVGDPVLAVGNPLDAGISVSGGLVSALDRDIGASPYDDFVQTDAAINHGNSGGPLVDMHGQVVGINTAIFSPSNSSSGVGFAISSRGAQIVIKRLNEYGWLRPGWLGLKVQQLSPEMALALGQRQAEGSLVAYVMPGGPAEAGGLRVGDIILRIGSVAPSDERALLRTIAETPIGEGVTLDVRRNGEPVTLKMTVKEWPRAQWERFDPPIVMPRPRPIPANLGLDLAARDHGGLIIKAVAPNTDAADRGLVAGDVILRVQENPVTAPADAWAAIKQAHAEQRDFILVLVDPKVHRYPGPEWMALRIADY